MTAQLLSNNPKKLVLMYNGQELEIYPDSYSYISDFWDKSWWINGFRKNKIYIVFSNSNTDWKLIKIVEKDIDKKLSTKEACKIIKNTNQINYKKFCM